MFKNCLLFFYCMDLVDFNPWWKNNKLGKEFVKNNKRFLFNELINFVDSRQILVLTGLRRVGKSTLLFQLIDFLINKGIKSNHILYFNFDLNTKSIERIFNDFFNLTSVDFKREKVFVFLDEIQKLDNWQNEIKLFYDSFPNLKFFVSGSSSLFIEKNTKESLAGRGYSFQLMPLSFKEFLVLKNKEKFLKNINLFEKEIKSELNHYIITGGFPELLFEKNSFIIKKYIKELIIDKIIFIDIPKVFEIDEPELLQSLLLIISKEPGLLLDYSHLANDLHRNRKTISNYLFYLEKSFLIKKIYNYSKNLLTNERKKKKFYPVSTALSFLTDSIKGKELESLILQNVEIKFFFNDKDKEVDFVLIKNNELIGIEVKSNKKPNKKNLIHFIKKAKPKKIIILNENQEKTETIQWFKTKTKIYYKPIWKWLLEN